METEFTPIASLAGGLMIGLAATLLLATTGRIAGISGLAEAMLPPWPGGGQARVAAAFVAGLLLAPLVYRLATGAAPQQTVSDNLPLMAAAGLIVGFGTVTGSGCTSGHGVCGLSRLSPRSLVATLVFMATAFATVTLVRHAL
jgi:uncharacterized membrane protein YedE/YeeE